MVAEAEILMFFGGNLGNKWSLCTLWNLFLHSDVLRVKFKLPFALTVKQKKKIARLEGLSAIQVE